MLRYSISEKFQKSDAIACDYYEVSEDEKFLKKVSSTHSPIGCGIIFKKKDLLSIGCYDTEMHLNEEVDLRIRFEKKYTIGHLPLPLYRYRKHKKNSTKNSEKLNFYKKKLTLKYK